MKHLLEQLLDWYRDHLTYGVIGLLMAAESSIIPIPSEAVIPFAAHQAYTNSNVKLSVLGIVIVGTIGSWLGASLMYWASRAAGRPLVLRYGRYAMLSPEKIEGAERWASHFGSMGIFISRLLPVVRHLIGIPAGIVRMDYKLFSLYTILGSGLWCAILCWLGIRIGQDQMHGAYHRIVIVVSATMILLGAVYYFFVHRHMKATPGKAK